MTEPTKRAKVRAGQRRRPFSAVTGRYCMSMRMRYTLNTPTKLNVTIEFALSGTVSVMSDERR